MSQAPAFLVANFQIHDAAKYREYEKGFFPILKNMAAASTLTTTIWNTWRGNLRVAVAWSSSSSLPNKRLTPGGPIRIIRHSPNTAVRARPWNP